MATSGLLDFPRLFSPIEEDRPAGKNLRDDASSASPYYAIKDARSAARAAERQLDAGDDAPDANAHWRKIVELAPDLLAEQSKDLEVTAWLTEALLRLNGFAGLRDGFHLAGGLIENFWDDIYPHEDEDGLATKVAPLTGLNGEDGEGTLIVPIRRTFITNGSGTGPFATWHYEQALELEKITDPEKREQRVNGGAVSLGEIEAAVAETDPEFFETLLADLGACAEEFDRLCAALGERCGAESPPSSNIRNALERCREALQFLTRDIALDREKAGANAESEPASGVTPSAGGAVTSGALASREDAFRTILQVAEYFRQREPHSPISYALEQVVRWGRMGLPQLMGELLPDEDSRRRFYTLTGIRNDADSE